MVDKINTENSIDIKLLMARLKYIELYLEKSNKKGIPSFERLKYIELFTDKLNSFFSDMDSAIISEKILDDLKEIYSRRDRFFYKITEELRENNIIHQRIKDLEDDLKSYIHNLFFGKIFPSLNVIIINEKDELPVIKNGASYLTAILKTEDEDLKKYLIAEIPSVHDIIYTRNDDIKYILIEDVLLAHVNSLAIPYEVEEAIIISLTKNTKINEPIKLDISGKISNAFKSFLSKKFLIDKDLIIESLSGVSFKYVNNLEKILTAEQTDKLTYPKIVKKEFHFPTSKIKEILKQNERISLTPFEAAELFPRLLTELAENYDLIEIRGTANDMNEDLVYAIEKALSKGSRVNLLAELKEGIHAEKIIPNIIKMENLGAKIYYSSSTKKINFNYYQLLYREFKSGELKTITYFLTGNGLLENDDNNGLNLSYLSTDPRLSMELASYFDYLSEQSQKHKENDYDTDKTCIIYGDYFYNKIIELIDYEKRRGSNGRIFIKVKNLTNYEIIMHLIKAAEAGVKIRIITSGANLIHELDKKTYKNIDSKIIIGRFNDDINIYLFGSMADELLYISSGDLDIKNLMNYELAIRLKDKNAVYKTKNILNMYYKDNIDSLNYY